MRAAQNKAWKGAGLEGWVARGCSRTRRNDIEDFRREAKTFAEHLRRGAILRVLWNPPILLPADFTNRKLQGH